MRVVDRYLFAQVVRRYAAVVAVVVAVLALENIHRLTADLIETTRPLHLLGRLSLLLAPEHLAIANPLGTFLAVALTVRALTMRGEWQIFGASGMSPTRTLLAPMLLATLATGVQLADRLEWRPHGERGLDALYREIASGEHGTPLRTQEPQSLDDTTTIIAEGASRDGGSIMLRHVIVRQAADVLYAPRARVVSLAQGGIVLDLQQGTAMHAVEQGGWRRVGFAHFHVGGSPPGLGLIEGNARQQLDRLPAGALWRAAWSETAPPNRARAAMVARIESGLFLLLLPWLGMTLGAPPLRGHGAAGLAVGVLLIVAHQQLGAFVEDRFASYPVTAGCAHLLLWVGIVAGASRAVAIVGGWTARLRGWRPVRPASAAWLTAGQPVTA